MAGGGPLAQPRHRLAGTGPLSLSVHSSQDQSERVRVLFLVVRLHPKYTGRFRLCEGLRVTSDITAAEAAIVVASTGYATSVYRCYWSVVLVNISSQCSELLHTARACLFPFIIIRKIKALLYDTAIVVGRDDAYRGTVGQV